MSQETVWSPGRESWGGAEELRGEDVWRDTGTLLCSKGESEGLNFRSGGQCGRRWKINFLGSDLFVFVAIDSLEKTEIE